MNISDKITLLGTHSVHNYDPPKDAELTKFFTGDEGHVWFRGKHIYFLYANTLYDYEITKENEEMEKKYSEPSYYADRKYEPKDVIAVLDLNFFMGNVVKYIARAGKKDNNTAYDDISKAIVYAGFELDRLDHENYVPNRVENSFFFRSWEEAVIKDWGFADPVKEECFRDICDYATSTKTQERAAIVSSLRRGLIKWQSLTHDEDKKRVTPYTKEWAKGFNAGLDDVIEYVNSTANTMTGTSILIPRSEIIGHCKASKVVTNTSLAEP